jgi:hypothetical protein
MRKNSERKNVLCQFLAWAIIGLWSVGCSGTSTSSSNHATAVPFPAAIIAPTVAIAPIHLAEASGKIAFDSDRDGNMEIYAMNADGSSPTNLTKDMADDAFPDWSAGE